MLSRRMIVVLVAVALAGPNLGLASREYTYELTVRKPSAPNYDPNTDYTTINAAIDEMNSKDPPLGPEVLGCIRVYEGTYVEALNDKIDDSNNLPAHCDLIGMGRDTNDVVIEMPYDHRLSFTSLVACNGDNIVRHLKVDVTVYSNIGAANGIGFWDDGTLEDCIVDTRHASIGGRKNLLVRNCESTGLGCVSASGDGFLISDCNLYPLADRGWLETTEGITARASGRIENVNIEADFGSSYQITGACLAGVMLYLYEADEVTISNVNIDLTLTSTYDEGETGTLRLAGILSGRPWFDPVDWYKGKAVVSDCRIDVNGIESTGSDPNDPNDDGQGIMVDGICVRGGGIIDVLGQTEITTSRTTASHAEDGYEYSLNNENGTIAVCAAPNAVIYDANKTNGTITELLGVVNITQCRYYLSIQDAIDDANSGDEIVVYPGTYYEAVDFNSMAITLRSKYPNDPNVVAATIIDANGTGNVVTFDNNEGASSVLEGFTITNGNRGIYCYYASPTISKCVITGNATTGTDDGAGMYNYYSDPNVLNCTFSNNESASDSGGMENYYSDPVVANCTFSGNTAYDDGGGMANHHSHPVITDCTFTDNNSTDDGGGLYNSSSSHPVIVNCTFSGNSAASDGGGMHNNWADPNVIECTFSNNTAYDDGGGMFSEECTLILDGCIFSRNTAGDNGGGMYNDDCVGTVTSCVFWDNNCVGDGGGMHNYDYFPTLINCTFALNESLDGNGGGIFNCGVDVSDGILINCIIYYNDAEDHGDEIYNDDSDPNISYSNIDGCDGSDDWDDDCGVDGGGNIDQDPCFVYADANDFHLSEDSPCIDTGDPNGDYTDQTDIDGEPRVMRGRVDMGADEKKITWYVDGTNGSNNNDGYSWATAFATIQKGIDSAKDDDVIEVNEATYSESVEIKDKAITVQSTRPQDWDVVENTVIEGTVTFAAVKFDGAQSTVTGFTIDANNNDVGAYATDGSDACITWCLIESFLDFGVYHDGYNGGSLNAQNNKICCAREDPNIGGCGISCETAAPATIKNNWIYDNKYGIAIDEADSAGTICNNTVADNDSVGIYLGGGVAPAISNCIIWNNADDMDNCSATYSCISDCNDAIGVGNICGDANNPSFVDPNNDDYHLDANSPCIDAGEPNGDYANERDIDDAYRVVGGPNNPGDPNARIDMGADEQDCFPSDYSTYDNWVTVGRPDCWCASPIGSGYQCDGDADGTTEGYDYRVGPADLDLIVDNWMKKIDDPTLDPCADIDHKGQGFLIKYQVYTDDLGILVTNWMKKDSDLNCDCPRQE